MAATLVAAFRVSGAESAPADSSSTQAVSRPRTGEPWRDMDYGPFLSASIESPGFGTNIAFKGIAIPLGRTVAGEPHEAVVFDTDLLRYSSAWTGNFVALKGVVFDGEHWAYPRIDGVQVFGIPPRPGWAREGSFEDPRPFIYGPLPRDWARWQGLYLHGERVVLSYKVGTTEVLELPGVEHRDGLAIFTRTIEVGPHEADLELQVATEESGAGQLHNLDTMAKAPAESAAGDVLVRMAKPAVALVDRESLEREASRGLMAHWTFDQEGESSTVDAVSGGHRLRLERAQFGEEQTGLALEFGGDGRATIEPPVELDFLESDLSVAVWIKTDSDGTILAQTAASGPWVPDAKALFLRNGRLTFDVGWVGAIESSAAIPLNRWVHVALTWARADGRSVLFLDGMQVGEGVLKPRQETRGHVTRLGFGADDFPATPHFRGAMDELRLYRRSLTAAEVAHLAGGDRDEGVLMVGVKGVEAGARWVLGEGGEVRLRLPASTAASRFKLMVGREQRSGRERFAARVRNASPAESLAALTKGGPARWPEELVTRGRLGTNDGPYAIDAITWPDENPWNSWMRFGGLDFFSDPRRAAICTWSGDVWVVDGLDAGLERLGWRRFATGLFQPLGLRIVEDQVYVLGRDQITRLHDLNGDGEADFYENFNHDTMVTEHFHEFAMDLQTDAAGDFYYMKAARHARDALHPQHGTLMKVSRDGRTSEIIAKGFRAPNGLAISPEGEFFSTDQEGYWMPANRLNLIRPGGFYGNVWSWFPDGKPTVDDPPMCWIHPRVDRSPSTMSWVTSDRWGLPPGTLLSLSYGVGKVFVVMTETVNGLRQGGITPLPIEFDTGVMRTRFHPVDGQLYVCGLFGWAGNKTVPGGFHRVRFTGHPLAVPDALHAVKDGVVLHFAVPLDPASAMDAGSYSVERWNYRWTQNYGSPDYKLNGEPGRDRLAVKSARLAADARTVFLEIPDLAPAMQMNIQFNLKTGDGRPLQSFVHHTIHALGAESGADRLGAESTRTGPVAAAVKLEREAPGAVLTIAPMPGRGPEEVDHRLARLVALTVPAGTAPTPFLGAGPFVATWEGYLRADLTGEYRFAQAGETFAELSVNGGEPVVLHGVERAEAAPPIALKAGLNPFRIRCPSGQEGALQFRLFWRESTGPWEPVSPHVLVHDAAAPGLREGDERRHGRQLFATRQCVKCHLPESPWESSALPELAAEGVKLEAVVAGLRQEWLLSYLGSPGTARPETLMPGVLRGTDEEVGQQARDLAAFLGTLVTSEERDAASAPLADVDLEEGRRLFGALGCVACHWLPGATRLENDTRLPLGQVRAKWQPTALAEFLANPTKRHAWTRMPDFQLKPAEAGSLAGFLMESGDPSSEATADAGAEPGDAVRGRVLATSLGCANCHELSLPRRSPSAASLDQLAARESGTGCLTEDPARRGLAPDFGFSVKELAALRRFVKRDLVSLRRTVPAEEAERHYEFLRCGACHERGSGADVWSTVQSLDPAAAPAANPYDDDEPAAQTVHNRRPPLTWAGEKLRPEWTERLLRGQLPYKVRPKMEARMPAFPAHARELARGLAMAHGCPPESPEAGPANPGLVVAGDALARKGALGCVDCHAVADQPALAGADTVTINFSHIPDRLRKEYYDAYVFDPPRWLPGTMMPQFVNDDGTTGIAGHFNGDARRQFDALWHFMRHLPPAPGTNSPSPTP
ncbi:MAG: DUF6797 domain-containing protein [Limisphaerales bacterium]